MTLLLSPWAPTQTHKEMVVRISRICRFAGGNPPNLTMQLLPSRLKHLSHVRTSLVPYDLRCAQEGSAFFRIQPAFASNKSRNARRTTD